MMRSPVSRTVMAASIAAALMSCQLAGAAVPAPAAHALSASDASAKRQIDQLADAFYRARSRFDPLMATANGDSRYDDQLGGTIDPVQRKRQFALYHRMRGQLGQIRRDRLDEKDQTTYDLLDYELKSGLRFEAFPEHLLPLNQFDNVPATLANYAGGTGSQPLGSLKQQEAYLSRLRQLPGWIDQAIANMREGVRHGVVQPTSIIRAMLPQFQQMRAATVEASVFYSPATRLPAGLAEADKARLVAGYHDVVAKGIAPALDRLVAYLEKDYLPAGRASTGLGALPNGKAWYQARIKENTTTDMTAEQIHALGLSEVARVQREWTALGPKLGYDGPPNALPQWVAAQDKFKPFTTDEQVLDAYRQIDAQVRAKLPAYFSLLPKAKLVLQLEPELSRATASDHYTPPAADGSHPGVFWAVVNDPKKYSRTGMVTLFLHEGQPGHHLHAALLKEMDLPDFRKFDTEYLNCAAYAEGWALYSETLGHEFGFYDNPEYYFGHLNDELLRAVRLVVDTGMHAKGWTREQAIAYMRDTLGYSEARAGNQVERYMAWPAQALAYKIGALKILELRERARKALGERFTYSAFHAVVLGDGTLPLPILEAKVDRWIARMGAGSSRP